MTRPTTKAVLLSLVLIALTNKLEAQSTNGWYIKPYKNNVTRLEWKQAGMTRSEAIGDAVIQKPSHPGFLLKVPSDSTDRFKPKAFPETNSAAEPTYFLTKNRISLHYQEVFLNDVETFDSGHVRGFRIPIAEKEYWVGTGERSLPIIRNGQRISLYNAPHYGYELNAEELNYSVPFIISTNGYGLLFDNPAKGYMDFGKTTPGVLEIGFVSGNLNVFVIPGKTPKNVLQTYAWLTGKQPLPPRWALGNFASRFGYTSEQQTRSVVAQMQAANFPLDAVIIDIFWFGDSIQGTLGNLDWVNQKKWPNPQKMIADFKKDSLQTILVTEPFFLKNTRLFEASQPYLATDSNNQPFMLSDFYFGYGGLIDLFKSDARRWFWRQYTQQMKLGVGAWWGDLGEPEKHPSTMYHNLSAWGIERKMGSDEVHGLYGHMWSKMMFENWQKDYPNKRLFFLNRAGYAGSQRFSIFPWTGDVSRSWNGFKAQLNNLQSMSLSGVPYIHSDAGGFSMTDEKDSELYIRWLQMAAFSPIFRPHGTALGNTGLAPSQFDLPSEPVFKPAPYQAMARTIINQRYRLLPYLYTMAWQQTQYGLPLIRPLILDGVSDSTLLTYSGAYLFGDAFLVSPVTERGAKTQVTYLPAGNWYSWHDGSQRIGKNWILDSVSLEKMPLFVKAGSLVAQWKKDRYTNTSAFTMGEAITLEYFPSSKVTTTFFYDDDGNTPNIEKMSGKYQLIEIKSWSSQTEIRFDILPKSWPKNTKRGFFFEIPLAQWLDTMKTKTPYAFTNGKIALGKIITGRNGKTCLQIPITYTGLKQQILVKFM